MQTGEPSDSRQRETEYTAISATVNLIFHSCYASQILEMNFKNELSLQDFMDVYVQFFNNEELQKLAQSVLGLAVTIFLSSLRP